MRPALPAHRGPAIERFVRRLVAGPRDAVTELARVTVELTGGAAVVVLVEPGGTLRLGAFASSTDEQAFGHIVNSVDLDGDTRAAFVDAHPDLPVDRLPAAWAWWARAHQPLRSIAVPLSCGEQVLGWLWSGAHAVADRVDQLRDLAAVAALRHAQETTTRADSLPLVEHQAQLSEKVDAVEHANQAFDQVGVRIGSDVRDAAREVLSLSRLGADVTLAPEQQAELLLKIRRASERLGAILGEVLEDVEEVKSERRDAITVDLNGPMGWVRRVLAEQIELQHAELVVDTLPTILATSPTLLRGVLLELVRNAVEHGGPGVRVHVGVVRLDDKVELVVEDDGPGIDPELRDAMFEPGFTTGRGVGLGLARVRHGVAAMGGTVVAQDSPSGGTAVHVVLPRHGAQLSVSTPPLAPHAD